jgi:hypothetical protein
MLDTDSKKNEMFGISMIAFSAIVIAKVKFPEAMPVLLSHHDHITTS